MLVATMSIDRRCSSTSARSSSRRFRERGPQRFSARSASASFRSAASRVLASAMRFCSRSRTASFSGVGLSARSPARLVPRAGRQRALVDGEPLDRGLLECAAEAGERVAVVEVVEVALALARGAGDVEAGLLRARGRGRRSPTPAVAPAGAEDEGALDGDALGGVAGERVCVADVARLEVAAAELDRSPRSVTTSSVRCLRSTARRCRGCRS